jgi:hypothetical protein
MDMHQYSENLSRAVIEERGRVQAATDGGIDAIVTAGGAAIAWRTPSGSTPEHREVDMAARAVRIATKAAAKVATIQADPDRSPEWKAREEAKAGDEARAEFAKVASDAERMQAEFVAADARDLAPPALAPTDVVGGLLDRELRDYVRSLTAEGHNALAQSIINGGDPRMLDALQRSPIALPAVLAAVVPAAREALLLKDNPAYARQASEARARNEWLATVVAQAQGALPRAVGTARQQLDAQRDATVASRS